jgi:hypothetical protein
MLLPCLWGPGMIQMKHRAEMAADQLEYAALHLGAYLLQLSLSLQDSLEGQYNELLARHRPCHYAINNGTGQVIWVPKYTPCWFEGHPGKLVIDLANGPRCESPHLEPFTHPLDIARAPVIHPEMAHLAK